MLCNDPRVPDRSSARLGQGEDPLAAMMVGIRRLEGAGARLIAIPCNTAHLWYDQLAQQARVPLLHIVEAVCDDLARLGIRGARIGLMGTPATLALGLYQGPLTRRGHSVIEPDAQERQLCIEAIAAVKCNRPEMAFAPAAACIARLAARGADAIVLGCTELPLAVPHAQRAALGVVLTDSIDALARAAIGQFHRVPREAGNDPTEEEAMAMLEMMADVLWLYDIQSSLKPQDVPALCRWVMENIKPDHIVIDSLMKCGLAPTDRHFNRVRPSIDPWKSPQPT